MKRMITAAVLAALLAPWVAIAQSQPGRYTVYGHGSNTCRKWTEDRKAATRQAS